MNAYIVCEGVTDAQLLQNILPKNLLNDVEIVVAGGLSAVKSLARSLLVRRQVPLAIVVDSDSIVPELVHERLRSIEELIGSVAIDTPFKVILAVPSIEIIFFQNPDFLSRRLGHQLSPDILNLATSQPHQALKTLLSQSGKKPDGFSLFDDMNDEDLENFRKTQVVQELIRFLQSVQETVNVG